MGRPKGTLNKHRGPKSLKEKLFSIAAKNEKLNKIEKVDALKTFARIGLACDRTRNKIEKVAQLRNQINKSNSVEKNFKNGISCKKFYGKNRQDPNKPRSFFQKDIVPDAIQNGDTISSKVIARSLFIFNRAIGRLYLGFSSFRFFHEACVIDHSRKMAKHHTYIKMNTKQNTTTVIREPFLGRPNYQSRPKKIKYIPITSKPTEDYPVIPPIPESEPINDMESVKRFKPFFLNYVTWDKVNKVLKMGVTGHQNVSRIKKVLNIMENSAKNDHALLRRCTRLRRWAQRVRINRPLNTRLGTNTSDFSCPL